MTDMEWNRVIVRIDAKALEKWLAANNVTKDQFYAQWEKKEGRPIWRPEVCR